MHNSCASVFITKHQFHIKCHLPLWKLCVAAVSMLCSLRTACGHSLGGLVYPCGLPPAVCSHIVSAAITRQALELLSTQPSPLYGKSLLPMQDLIIF